MPEYNYECRNCHAEFVLNVSFAEREKLARKRAIHCPKCESPDVKHVVEPFFVSTSKKS